jgi:putative membrane protein
MATQTLVEVAVLRRVTPRQGVRAILVASVAVLAALLLVIYGHGRAEAPPSWIAWLPALNAFLNATSAVLLVSAAVAVRRRDFARHARLMLSALLASALFLVSYIVYHAVHGDTPFAGRGAVRPVYFFVLITHVVLSAVVLPLIFSSLFFSLSGRFGRHRAVSRYTLPVWLYVSVTGVVVFAMLRIYG